MAKFKLTALACGLMYSLAAHGQNASVDDVVKVGNNQGVEIQREEPINGVVSKITFPKAIIDPKGSSRETWKFTQGEIDALYSNTHARRILGQANVYRPVFSSALLSGGLGSRPASTDTTLLMAIAARESGFNPKARSQTGARGLMQITKGFYADVMRTTRGRAISTSIEDSFDPYKAVKIASIGFDALQSYLVNGGPNRWVDPSGLPPDNVANAVRAYNGGQGTVFENGKKRRLVAGMDKEAFQYAYYVGFYYYLLGGNRPYFKHFFEGNDPFLISRGLNGTGKFEIQTTNEAPDIEAYKLPPQECSANYGSPLEQKLVVNSTYGPRYDYNNQRARFKNSVDFVAAINTPVQSMSDGVVISVERSAEFGNTLLIRNANGTVFAYGSVKDITLIGGQSVKKGDVIAKVADNNGHQSPQLMLSYFPDGKGDLSLNEANNNHADPLSVYCGPVDIPAEVMLNKGALSEMLTVVSDETANSVIGALEAMIENRLGNKQWLMDISRMEEARLYAELAYINAISLKQDHVLRQLNEKLESLSATAVSLENEKVLGKEAKTKEAASKF